MRRTSYQTHYVHRRRRRGMGAAGWIAALAVLGVVVYVALAMGAGSWLHGALFAREDLQENEISDVETSPAPTLDASGDITETVAFPAMEAWLLSCGTFETGQQAQSIAATYRTRGGAGFVLEGEDGYSVLLAAYDSAAACENVAQNLKAQEDIDAQVQPLTIDGVELRLTASARRIDGVRDAFSIWQQTVQRLSDLWQDVDGGVATLNQAISRLAAQRDKLGDACDEAFSEALIEGESRALDGLSAVLRGTYGELDALVCDPPQNILELSAKIKYTGIRSLTEYQSYVHGLKTE
ncbi:MAG: hypothetical protein ACI4XW_06455 [Candidatus Spyradocola sp.]